MLNAFFWVCLEFLPQKIRLPLFFFVFSTGCLGLPPTHFPFLLSLFSLSFSLDESLKLERSLFKIQNTSQIIFGTHWEQIEKFWFQISCFFNHFLWVKWIWSHPNRWKTIHEISGLNKIHSRYTTYRYVSSMKCSRHQMWIEIALLNLPSTTPYFLFQGICKGIFGCLLKAITPTDVLRMSIGKAYPF